MHMFNKAALNGWAKEQSMMTRSIHKYWTYPEEISHGDGLLLKANQQMINQIHESHLGIVKCTARGETFCPGQVCRHTLRISLQMCDLQWRQEQQSKSAIGPTWSAGRPRGKQGHTLFTIAVQHFCYAWTTFQSTLR